MVPRRRPSAARRPCDEMWDTTSRAVAQRPRLRLGGVRRSLPSARPRPFGREASQRTFRQLPKLVLLGVAGLAPGPFLKPLFVRPAQTGAALAEPALPHTARPDRLA